MIRSSRKSFIRLGHATDQKCNLGLIRLRIFKMRWVSVANDHLGPKPLILDNVTRRSLWPLECQPVALEDNEWQILKTLIQSSIQTHGQVNKKSNFDIWHFWKSYCWLRIIWGIDHRSRSRSRRSRYILPGAGDGAGAAKQFYSEPEPEPEPDCFPGAGAGADQKCHGSAPLVVWWGISAGGPNSTSSATAPVPNTAGLMRLSRWGHENRCGCHDSSVMSCCHVCHVMSVCHVLWV